MSTRFDQSWRDQSASQDDFYARTSDDLIAAIAVIALFALAFLFLISMGA